VPCRSGSRVARLGCRLNYRNDDLLGKDGQNPVRWLPDGSRVVEVASTADDSHLTVTTTRTITISFPAKGPPKFLNSTLKVTTGKL
jgi:hypothetical protein